MSRRGPGTKGKRQVLKQVIGYLEARVKLMDYGRLRADDLVIASGVVEGAARYVVGERLDNRGMRWIEERAEAVLLLRCIEVNGDWEDFMQWSRNSATRSFSAARRFRSGARRRPSYPKPHEHARRASTRSATLLGTVLLRPPGMRRQKQRRPRLQAPRQTGHHHVGPVAHQVVHRHRQRLHATLQLGDQVLLVAAVVGQEHDLRGRCGPVVGDVEEVPVRLEEPQLALLDHQLLAEHDHPVRLLAGDGPVGELGDLLTDSFNVSYCRSATIRSRCRSRAWRGTVWRAYRGGRSNSLYFRSSRCSASALRLGMASMPKMKRMDILVPAVQVFRLAEVGVAPEGDPAESRPTTQGGGLVQIDMGLLVRGTVATAVDQVQRLGGVRQRDDQRVVTPHPVVGDVHPLLAPAVRRGERAVGINEGLLEELVGLLLPDPQSGLVEDVHQPLDIRRREAAAEVPGGGGVGDAFGPQGVEIDLVVAADLQMFQAAAAGQEVVGDVQDVVALVIRQVPLQQVEALVDVVDQSDLLGQQVDGPDATGGDGPCPVRRVS